MHYSKVCGEVNNVCKKVGLLCTSFPFSHEMFSLRVEHYFFMLYLTFENRKVYYSMVERGWVCIDSSSSKTLSESN